MNNQLKPLSLEKRKMALINYTTENPYSITVIKAKSKFRLRKETILQMIALLNLEIIGHERKNLKRDIETFILYNPKMTAKSVSEAFNVCESLVYGVGKKMNHRFETKHTIKNKLYSLVS